MAKAARKSIKKTRKMLELGKSIHRGVRGHDEKSKAIFEKPCARMLIETTDRNETRIASWMGDIQSVFTDPHEKEKRNACQSGKFTVKPPRPL